MALSIKGRLEFTIKHKSLIAVLEELRTERLSLKAIVKGMKTQREYEAREPSRTSMNLSQLFSNVHARATSLFHAMCKTCICMCHGKHKVLIRLDNRIPDQGQGAHMIGKTDCDVAFELFWPIEDGVFQETTVRATTNEVIESNDQVPFM